MRKRIEQIIIQALEYQRGDAWLTLTEASSEFRLSKKKLYTLIHKGRVKAIWVGNSYRVKRNDLIKTFQI